MKALMKKDRAPGAELVDIDIPEIGPKDVLVKVKATAICGTDVHIYDWTPYAQARIKPPMIFGHETYGEIVSVGNQITNFKPGDLVAVETHIPCEECYNSTVIDWDFALIAKRPLFRVAKCPYLLTTYMRN